VFVLDSVVGSFVVRSGAVELWCVWVGWHTSGTQASGDGGALGGASVKGHLPLRSG